MKDAMEISINTKHKPSRRKYFIAAVLIFLCIFAGLIYRVMTWEPKPDPASEKIIRETAAKQLDKNPNELTDEDFAKITELFINAPIGSFIGVPQELSDIILLEKCTNLQSIMINDTCCPQNKIPKWMKALSKFGLYDLNKQSSLDLGPLEKLTRLEKLVISKTPIKDLKPIEKLANLQDLTLTGITVDNFEHLKKLKKLKSLDINVTKVSDLEAIKELTNLESLTITAFRLTSIEPVKELVNLKSLGIYNSSISDLEPVKSLKNLKHLQIIFCRNITEEQIKDLQKTLPKLHIFDL